MSASIQHFINFNILLLLLSVPQGMLVCIQEKEVWKEGLLAALTPTFSIGIWHIHKLALGQFSKYGVMTYRPIREVT